MNIKNLSLSDIKYFCRKGAINQNIFLTSKTQNKYKTELSKFYFEIEDRKPEDILEDIDYMLENNNYIFLNNSDYNILQGDGINYPFLKEILKKISTNKKNKEILLDIDIDDINIENIEKIKEFKNLKFIINIDIDASLNNDNIERKIKLIKENNVEIDSTKLKLYYKISDLKQLNDITDIFVENKVLNHAVIFSGYDFINHTMLKYETFKEEHRKLQIETEKIISKYQNNKLFMALFPIIDAPYIKVLSIYPNSDFEKTGLMQGDEIMIVNNDGKPWNSNDTYSYLENQSVFQIRVKREDKIQIVTCPGGLKTRQSLILSDSISCNLTNSVYFAIQEDVEHVLVLLPDIDMDMLKKMMETVRINIDSFYHYTVKAGNFDDDVSNYHHYSTEDYINAYNNFIKEYPKAKISRIIIPVESFMYNGDDSFGDNIFRLEKISKANVELY